MMCRFDVRTIMLFLAVLLLAPQGAEALEERMNTATLGVETQYNRFKSDTMKEHGILYGANGAYTYRGRLVMDKLPKGMFRLEGRIIFGRIQFDGQLFDGNHYDIKKAKDFDGEVRSLVGYDFPVFSSTTVTPFIGMGYRYFRDDLSKSNAGYRRISNYFYTPVGFETRTPFGTGWSAGLVLEYDLFWFGRQDTYLSDLDPLFSDLTNDQDSGYGFKTSIKVRKEMDDKNYVLEPYVSYWNAGSSDTQKVYHTGVYGGLNYQEPESSTTEIGVKAGVEF
ncbi:MAG: hypothetical protein IT395_01970 [Candidatus Omnitrophica bacterium]|nr:hypothetical protein [Candidatus Omnitrophota bacterium]